MNEKEARELTDGLICEFNDWDEKKKYAFGYLEAIEKAKVLEEALMFVREGVKQFKFLEGDKEYQFELLAKEALAKWEKEK